MFKNLLDPNSEKALSKALETLDQHIADQRQALVHLIISNQEKLAESELIDQIKELNTLFDLFQQAEEKLKPRIENLLAKEISNMTLADAKQTQTAFEIVDKAILSNQQDVLFLLAKFCEQEELCQKVISKLGISKKELLLQEGKSDVSKALIVKHIDNLETLKRLEKETKGKDKKTYRIIQEKVELLESIAAQKNLLLEKAKHVLDSMQKLSKTSFAPLYDSKFLHIESEWLNLQEEIKHSNFSIETIIDTDAFNAFSEAAKQCQLVINEVVAAEKKTQVLEQNQLFLEKALVNLKAFLSAESIDIHACTQLIQSIHDKLNESTLSKNFDTKTFSLYQAAFAFHQSVLAKANELEMLDTKITELQTLFASNHKKKKAEQNTLLSIQGLLKELANIKRQSPKELVTLDFDIEALKILKTKEKALQDLEKQYLDMQLEFLQKMEKKLGYVKTELENKALTTVIRLHKEAQELLAFCPVKQHEKLQKRLDSYQEDIVKLEDWFNFATLPKRKALCEQMAELAKNAPRSKINILKEDINKLQQQWKELGHARDSEGEALWKQFQEAGNLAYKPIKDLVERKEQEKTKNLETRQQILQKLTKHIDDFYSDSVKANSDEQKTITQSSEKLLRYAQADWNKAFPIPSGHQALQKTFDEKIKLLNEKLMPARSINLGKKNSLLAQAEKLIAVSNIEEAIEQAKKLQLEWKEVGYCENDEAMWTQFRAFCDKVFENRDSLRDEQKSKEQKSISTAKIICKAIDELDKEDVNEFESELRKLCSQYEDLKDLPKQRKDLQSNFLKVKKSAQSRLESLKRNHQTQSFQHVVDVCKALGRLEESIIAKTLNSDELENQFEALCTEFHCPLTSKLALKNSLLMLQKELQNTNDYLQQQKDSLRKLCVELEIELDINSPSQDKALRMELQVRRLNKKFNQSTKELSLSEKILSAFYLGGLFSFQEASYVNRLIAMQAKVL